MLTLKYLWHNGYHDRKCDVKKLEYMCISLDNKLLVVWDSFTQHPMVNKHKQKKLLIVQQTKKIPGSYAEIAYLTPNGWNIEKIPCVFYLKII